jgi:hypothetical protein
MSWMCCEANQPVLRQPGEWRAFCAARPGRARGVNLTLPPRGLATNSAATIDMAPAQPEESPVEADGGSESQNLVNQTESA